MNNKIERVKKHLKDNKKVYIAGGIGVAVGVVAMLVVTKHGVQIVDSLKIQVCSPTTNNVTQTILNRRGHPGNVIRCIETGEVFASQNRAALVMDVNPGQLAQHLKGRFPSVKGFTFEKLGEAA